jgi:two-component system response regulator QseB
MKIFLIEDDIAIGEALLGVFHDEGFKVVWCRLAANAIERIRNEHFDVLLLDLGLPDLDGTEVLQSLRAADLTLPVLVITARESLQDRLGAFNLGADDYLIKPFEIPELLVRLRALARRAGITHDQRDLQWSLGSLMLNEARKSVTLDGKPVALSKTEFALLQTLFRKAGQVITRAEIEKRVLGSSEGKSLDVHVFNLRKKIGDGRIRTVRGIGYLLQAQPDAA